MPAGVKPREVAARGRDRRRHHGRRHRHELRQCRHSGDARRDARRRRWTAASRRSRKNYASTVSRGGLDAGEMDARIGLIQGTTDFAARRARPTSSSRRCSRRWSSRSASSPTSTGSPSRARSSPPTPRPSTSTRSPRRRSGRRTCSARTSSARRTSCGCSRSCAARRPRPTRSRPRSRSARKIGKVPVVVGVCYGFVGNRMLRLRCVEAERLILEGALPQEVDAALVEFGFPMGPFAMSDLAGIDIGWRIRQGARRARRDRRRARPRWAASARRPAPAIYRYEAGARTPIARPGGRADHHRRLARGSASQRRTIGQDEIVERLHLPDDQRGRAHPRGGHRLRGRATSTWSGSTAMAGRSGAAGRCSTPTRSASPIARPPRPLRRPHRRQVARTRAAARPARARGPRLRLKTGRRQGGLNGRSDDPFRAHPAAVHLVFEPAHRRAAEMPGEAVRAPRRGARSRRRGRDGGRARCRPGSPWCRAQREAEQAAAAAPSRRARSAPSRASRRRWSRRAHGALAVARRRPPAPRRCRRSTKLGAASARRDREARRRGTTAPAAARSPGRRCCARPDCRLPSKMPQRSSVDDIDLVEGAKALRR